MIDMDRIAWHWWIDSGCTDETLDRVCLLTSTGRMSEELEDHLGRKDPDTICSRRSGSRTIHWTITRSLVFLLFRLMLPRNPFKGRFEKV